MNYISDRSSDFTFTRKLTVKDLFNVKGVFAQFTDLHFLSFTAFSKFIRADLYTVEAQKFKQYFHIDVKNRSEIEAILQIIHGTSFDKEVVLTIHFESDLLEDIVELITDQKVELSVKPETMYMINSKSALYNIPCWTEYIFDAYNYDEQYEKLIKLWLINPHYGFIDLQFDYASFENKPLSELHKLYFYINMLRIWITRGTIAPDKENHKLTPRFRNSPHRCYIDEELNIRLNKEDVYFEIAKYLDKNGEDLSNTELNKIRKIIDIKFNDSLVTNWYLIDLDQNFKVMGDHYQIPYIAQLICNWLGITVPIFTLTKQARILNDIKKAIK